MNKLNDTEFVQEICRQLDASIAHLPVPVLQSLAEGRETALLQQAHVTSQEDDSLAYAVSRELDELGAVPAEIEARLDQIRHNAVQKFEQLQETRSSSKQFSLLSWIKDQFESFNLSASAGMLATACVLITAVSIFYVNSRPAGTLTLEDEISLVATAEDIELYENLEFYLWLAENESLTL